MARKEIAFEITAFVGGPYAPPRVPRNGFLRCKLRGRLKVESYSNGRIPWPHGRQGALCGDLVKALKTESLVAIIHYWGVSHATASDWRRSLGIERWTPGSWRLFRRNVDLARTPEARTRMSRQREGRKDLMTTADRERLRRIQRRPKSEEWKRKASERNRRRCALLGSYEMVAGGGSDVRNRARPGNRAGHRTEFIGGERQEICATAKTVRRIPANRPETKESEIARDSIRKIFT